MSITSANQRVRNAAINYSSRSLGDAAKIHPEKIRHWQDGRLELMAEELVKICKQLEINYEW